MTGAFPGKPEQDIFIIASNKLGLTPNKCLVIVGTYSSKKAGSGKIIAINPRETTGGRWNYH